MNVLNSLRVKWRAFWAHRLGWQADDFAHVLGDLTVRMLIVEKRCEALTPSELLYRRNH